MASEHDKAINGARMLRRIDKRILFCEGTLANMRRALEGAKRGRGIRCGVIEVAPDAGDVLLYTQEVEKYETALREWREILAITKAALSAHGVI
jgi:hypothetical protein